MFIRISNQPRSAPLSLGFLLILGLAIGQSHPVRFAYLIDVGGKYIKVALATHRVVARGSLEEIEELRSVMPEGREATPAALVRYDPTYNRLYVLAVQGPGHDIGQPTKRWVLVLKLPTFELVRRIDLVEGDVSPSMLLTPDGERLLVSYEVNDPKAKNNAENFVFLREVYDTKSFQRVEQQRYEVPREPYDPKAIARVHFSNEARFAADGQTIIDGLYEIVNGQVYRRQPPSLPKEVRQYLKRTEGRPYFLIKRLDRIGRRLLLWEVQDGGRQATGRFMLYDELAHPRLQEFYVKELEGRYPKIIAIWPDGRGFFFAKGDKELYVVKVANGLRAIRLETGDLQPSLCECIFTDR